MSRRRAGKCAAFLPDASATAASEFALVAPMFLLLVVGAIDFGGVLFVEFNLNGAVSAAADYALINASSVTSTGGVSLASQLVALSSSGHAPDWATATVVVNNGPRASGTSSSTQPGGTASNADSCYCPTISGATVTWGGAAVCASQCANGGLAGKFVTVSVARTYTPVFGSYGLIKNNTLTAAATVQVR